MSYALCEAGKGEVTPNQYWGFIMRLSGTQRNTQTVRWLTGKVELS